MPGRGKNHTETGQGTGGIGVWVGMGIGGGMEFGQDIGHCFAGKVEGGLARGVYHTLLAEAEVCISRLTVQRQDGSLPLLSLPGFSDDIARLRPVAERLADLCDDLVILGTGGSNLGAKALTGASPAGAGPVLHFPDNLDGGEFRDMLEFLNPARTGFLVISKSGSTAETLSQAIVVIGWLRDRLSPGAVGGHVVAITEPGDNPLRRLAARWNIECLDHDPGLGGRFSVLSLVGLLPLMVQGMDIAAVRDGALPVLESCLKDPEAPPVAGAAVMVGLMQSGGIGAHVLLPYASRLKNLTLWHRQLVAESLGKDGMGITPLDALGPVDQHSQLQLWLDGPADKMFTLITIEDGYSGPPIDLALCGDDPALDYLSGRGIGDVVAAEARATRETLIAKGRPLRHITLPAVTPAAMGALFMHFMLETIIAAHLLGIDPFDQPAVETGKRLTRHYLRDGRG